MRTENGSSDQQRAFADINLTEADADGMGFVPLPTDITWQATRLIFQEVGTYNSEADSPFPENTPLYRGYLEYVDPDGNQRNADLSLTTSVDKPVLFTGTKDGFSAHDPLMPGSNNPYYVVSIDPDELRTDMTALCKLWHELGHTIVFHINADTQLLQAALSGNNEGLPPIRQAQRYAQELRQSLSRITLHNYERNPSPVTREQLSDHMQLSIGRGRHIPFEILDLFGERNATAAGAHLILRHGYPTGFQDVLSYFHYTRTGLRRHGEQFGNAREFVTGLKR